MGAFFLKLKTLNLELARKTNSTTSTFELICQVKTLLINLVLIEKES